MVAYSICTRIEQVAPRSFVTRAFAIPVDVGERCAPDERRALCVSQAGARAAAARLARSLVADVLARGNSVVPAGDAPIAVAAIVHPSLASTA